MSVSYLIPLPSYLVCLLSLDVDLALLPELQRHFFHPLLRVVADLLRQFHAAEFRTAHRAEVRDLGAVGGQRLVVVGTGGDGIERKVELILPTELEPRLRQRIVPLARARMAFGEIRG